MEFGLFFVFMCRCCFLLLWVCVGGAGCYGGVWCILMVDNGSIVIYVVMVDYCFCVGVLCMATMYYNRLCLLVILLLHCWGVLLCWGVGVSEFGV